MHDGERLSVFELVPGVVSILGHGNLTIIVWHSKPGADAVERLRQVSERRRRQHPHGVSAVHLIKGHFELPDSATRDVFVRLIKEGEGTLAAVAVVIPAAGFWASAVRSLITGLRVLSRGTFDMGLHNTVDDVVKWLPARHARTGVTLDPEWLERALSQADAFEQPGNVFAD